MNKEILINYLEQGEILFNYSKEMLSIIPKENLRYFIFTGDDTEYWRMA